MVVVMTTDPPTAKDIFVELVTNVAPDQWDQRLEEACQGDEVLRQRVRALLRAHAEPGSFLEQPAVGDATMIQERLISERPGTVIGPYTLLEQIGEGGMGVVFMAEQTQPVRRTVALKIIKPGMDTRQVIARFEAERQALAMMDHPNIARVLDAGTTGGGSRDEGPGPRASNGASLALDSRLSALDHSPGRPYFVMDLVKGVPITDYCDRQHLSIRERLELFAQVCQAVQHAHQKGIIHRDIKPSNVLVAEYDGKPVPKIIDFGVAKATAQKLTERTMFTEFGQLVGTVEYMSPEQARFNQLDIDTRSDIYSLGVLLYELLVGSTPLDRQRLQAAAFDETLRMIREDEPLKPSTRLSQMARPSSGSLPLAGRDGEGARSDSATIAANRRLEPHKLISLLRGELDWIVMKALEKERARRYETPNALAQDVERYLRDEPVEACPPSAAYRFRKFARRRVGLLAAISGVILMIVTAAAILIVSNVRISEALEQQIEAKGQLETALHRERDTSERERRNSYAQRIALADREWSANNLSRMDALLDECPRDLRGWEWHYLKRLRFSGPRPLRHESPVISVAFSRDARYVATGNQAGILTLWQTNTKQVRHSWQAHREDVISVAFSSDGRHLASASWDGTVKVWELANVLSGDTNEPLVQWEHTSRVWCVNFSPDGERLAAAIGRTVDETGEVKVWDLNSREAALVISSFTTKVSGVDFSPDGRRLATVSGESLQVWDAQTGQQQLACRDTAGNLQWVAFSPDGDHLATVGGLINVDPDREIKIWDAQSGRLIQSLRGHVGGLASVVYSPDGRRLASAGLDQTVKLWDVATGQEVLTLRGHRDVIRCLAFSADGRQIASASLDNTVRIWDSSPLERPKQEHLTLRGHKGPVTDVAFHPDGRSFVSAGLDGTLRIWETSSGKLMSALHGPPSFMRVSVAYSPDGGRLAAVHMEPQRRHMIMWDLASSKELDGFLANASSAICVAFSPDGRRTASAGFDSVVQICDATTGQELQVLKDHKWPIFDVAFSPDGRQLASGSGDGTVRAWDWSSGQVIRVMEPRHTARVQSVAYSGDGHWLASGSCDQTIKVWNRSTWELEHNLPDPTGAVLCVAFGPDCRLAWGSSDSTVKIWDGPGTETHVLRGHTSWVQAVAFSPDGEWIASASLDGTVKIWQAPPEVKTRAPEAKLDGD